MSTALQVDDEVFAALQALAVPLVDDVNSVLRRLLKLPSAPEAPPPSSSTSRQTPTQAGRARSQAKASRAPKRSSKAAKVKKTRAARGTLLPESAYEEPILLVLRDAGGRAPASEVVDQVGKLIDEQLRPADREPVGTGDVRWRNRVQFVRLKLIQAGDMKKDTPRGIWEISDQGSARLADAGRAQPVGRD